MKPLRSSFRRGLLLAIALVTLTTLPARVALSSTWQQLSPVTQPSARSYLAMTYDHVSKKVVLFGGFGASGYLNDTWTFDGTTWTQVATSVAPPPRANAQMAYDLRTRKVILFGGYNGNQDLGDTWLWDGLTSTWTQALPAHSPRAVTGPMVFTDLNGRVDVFGGFDGNLFQLTMYQWSGTDWRQLHLPMVPYARSGAAVGVNYKSKQVVLFGGLGDVNPNNTWTYDDVTWTMESPASQPPLVYSATATFDPSLGSVLLFGGGNGGSGENTTWSWDGSTWTELFPATSPGPREGAGMVYDAAVGRTVLFGGQSANLLLNDTWEFLP
jgi:Galactose oxidase, central domain